MMNDQRARPRGSPLLQLAVLAATAILLVALAPTGSAASQSGSGTHCLTHNALWVNEALSADRTPATRAHRVDVEPFTEYVVDSDTGDPVYVDFFDDNGRWITWNEGDHTGKVPSVADYATICVGQAEAPAWPTVPNTEASWTYEDGF